MAQPTKTLSQTGLFALLGLGLLGLAGFQLFAGQGLMLGPGVGLAVITALAFLAGDPPRVRPGLQAWLGIFGLGTMLLALGQGLLWHRLPSIDQPQGGLVLMFLGAALSLAAVWKGGDPGDFSLKTLRLPDQGDKNHLALKWEMLGFAAALACGIFFRTWQLGRVPEGIWFDEANYGSVILGEVLPDKCPLYIGGLAQHPGLFFWLGGLFFNLFGASVESLRLMSAFFGILGLAAFYFLARVMFGPRLALAGLAVYACLRWGVIFAREGLMITLANFWMLAAFAFFWRALKRPSAWAWILAGLSLGVSFHTYMASRLIPVALALFVAASFPQMARQNLKRHWAVFFLAWLVPAAPLLWYWAGHWGEYTHRASELLITNDIHRQGSGGWGLLLESFKRHLLMFNFVGDDNARHNLSEMPQLDALAGAAFFPAFFWMHLKFKGDLRARFLVVWFWVMLAAGILTVIVEAPQAHRTGLLVPAIPLALLLLLERAGSFFKRAFLGELPRPLLAAGLLLLVSLAAFNARDYFVLWKNDAATWRSYSPEATRVGRRLLRQGEGWKFLVSNRPKEYPFNGFEIVQISQFLINPLGYHMAPLGAVNPLSPKDLPSPGEKGFFCVWGQSDEDITLAAKASFPDLKIEQEADPFTGTPLYLAMEVPLDRIPTLKKGAKRPWPLLYRVQP